MASGSNSDAREWERSCLERERGEVLLASLLIFVFIPVFSVHDWLLEPATWRLHLILRLASVPVFVAVLVAGLRASSLSTVRRAMDVFYVTTTVLLAVMLPDASHYWPAVLGYSCLAWGVGATFALPPARALGLLSTPVVAFLATSTIRGGQDRDTVLGAAVYLVAASLIATGSMVVRYRTLFESHRARQELHRAHGELERAKADLERRVEERTEQLSETVEELQREVVVRIRAEEEAQQSTRAKSAFLANMSHELRTPLTAIIGYGELLGEELVELGRSEMCEDLSRIDQSARHLLATIDDVLDLTRIEAGQLPVHLAPVDPVAVLRKALTLVEPLAAARDNVVCVDAPEVGEVLADALRLRQVLVNLLSNAAKFTRGGRIEVTTRRLSDTVEIAVSDTGIGIAPDQVHAVFDRFRQVDDTPTRLYGGLGLGLAISRELVHAMGGAIEVDSVPGRGSTFRLGLRSTVE
ncbi:MAG: hypothetical protein KC621_00330 [Myxococcales bacterium]|nr:hypothetical protein [Myxococcales bacterium]